MSDIRENGGATRTLANVRIIFFRILEINPRQSNLGNVYSRKAAESVRTGSFAALQLDLFPSTSAKLCSSSEKQQLTITAQTGSLAAPGRGRKGLEELHSSIPRAFSSDLSGGSLEYPMHKALFI